MLNIMALDIIALNIMAPDIIADTQVTVGFIFPRPLKVVNSTEAVRRFQQQFSSRIGLYI